MTNDCKKMKRALSVEEIQNLVEDELMKLNAFSVARKYITYRFQRALARQSNTTDDQILSLIECANEEVKQEFIKLTEYQLGLSSGTLDTVTES